MRGEKKAGGIQEWIGRARRCTVGAFWAYAVDFFSVRRSRADVLAGLTGVIQVSSRTTPDAAAESDRSKGCYKQQSINSVSTVSPTQATNLFKTRSRDSIPHQLRHSLCKASELDRASRLVRHTGEGTPVWSWRCCR